MYFSTHTKNGYNWTIHLAHLLFWRPSVRSLILFSLAFFTFPCYTFLYLFAFSCSIKRIYALHREVLNQRKFLFRISMLKHYKWYHGINFLWFKIIILKNGLKKVGEREIVLATGVVLFLNLNFYPNVFVRLLNGQPAILSPLPICHVTVVRCTLHRRIHPFFHCIFFCSALFFPY